MAAWLEPLEAALDVAPAPCPFFFRDDDAGWADDKLLALLDVFARRELRVDVAVIPSALGTGLARELARRARDDGVRLHQHGFAHTNHEPAGRKCEFGASRSLADQVRDVAAGQTRLADRLGELVDLVFTPPWNRCTADTAVALAQRGVRVLSRDSTAGDLDRHGLAEVPVTVDWFGHRKGVRWPPSVLGERLAEGVRAGGPVGVMLHHAVMTGAERAAFDDLLAVVERHPAAAPATIMELAA